MKRAVRLSEIVESWDSSDPWTTFYLNKKTGQIIPITNVEFCEAEKPFHAAPEPDGSPDNRQIAKAVLDGDERYIRLPSRAELEEYAVMEQFCASVEDDLISETLSETLKDIRGSEAFEKALIRYGLAEDFHAWHRRESKSAAKEWCETHDIVFIEDI
jgi:hypothetical protein